MIFLSIYEVSNKIIHQKNQFTAVHILLYTKVQQNHEIVLSCLIKKCQTRFKNTDTFSDRYF